uniref:Uncharacterized protein n=1 Tax=viral metagenome TaxID=1070528 RepID=A0A6M3L022_9ZZZZ
MKRNKDETFEDYKKRRMLEAFLIKVKLYPRLFWDSKNKGTYRYEK